MSFMKLWMSYEKFVELKEAEKEVHEQAFEVFNASVDAKDEPQAVVVSEKADIEISKIEEAVLEEAEVVPEVIDYTKLSIEERASILPVPTDDYVAEYDAYCQRMGYTTERMKSIRYKMAVYDEFREEYDYRKDYYGVEVVKIMEISRKKGAK